MSGISIIGLINSKGGHIQFIPGWGCYECVFASYVGFVIFADEKRSNGGDFALNRGSL